MRYLLIFLIFILPAQLFSSIVDTNYIEKNIRKYSLRFIITNKTFSLSIKPPSNDSIQLYNIKYSPNLTFSTGFGISYNNILLNISFRLPFTEKDEKIYGSTDFKDYALGLKLRSFWLSAYYKYYRGFYIKNPGGLFKNWNNNSPNPQRTDLFYENYGFEFYYVFNKDRFSLNATQKLTERQKRSVGSFLFWGEYFKLKIRADSTLVQSNLKNVFGKTSEFVEGNYPTVSVSAGYSYCWVISRFFLNPSVFAGPGFITRINKEKTVNHISSEVFPNLLYKINAGYNGKRVFGGIFISAKYMFIKEEQINFQSVDYIYNFFFGIRF